MPSLPSWLHCLVVHFEMENRNLQLWFSLSRKGLSWVTLISIWILESTGKFLQKMTAGIFFLLEITFNLLVNFRYIAILTNLPGGSDGKNICLQCRRPGFEPWVGKIPWRRKWQPTPVFLPGKSHGRRSLAGYSPWGFKESDMTEWLHFCHFNNIKSSCLWLCDAFLFI